MSHSYQIGKFERFVREELELELKLKALQARRVMVGYVIAGNVAGSSRFPEFGAQTTEDFAQKRDKALRRNRELLKELEIEVAKLRSRTCYCPTELQLHKLRSRYQAATKQ